MKHLVSLGLVVLLGCAGSAPVREAGTVPENQPSVDKDAVAAWERSCSSYQGRPVTIKYEDAAGGASVLFTTEGDPNDLRVQVTDLARYHNGSSDKSALHGLYDLPHTARVEDIEGGARLILLAQAQNDTDTLRKHVQQDVTLMQKSGCAESREAL